MAATVRPATPRDREFVDRLGRESAPSSLSPLRPASAEAAAEAFRRAVTFTADRADALTLIAELDGEAAGFLMLLFDLPDDVTLQRQAFVVYMAVRTASRKRGLGRALLAAAVEEARKRGVAHISLMVTEANAPARALYAQAGFVDERVQMTKKILDTPR
jgi:ribosomal protein S18 acetylase RimI-like enzyme